MHIEVTMYIRTGQRSLQITNTGGDVEDSLASIQNATCFLFAFDLKSYVTLVIQYYSL